MTSKDVWIILFVMLAAPYIRAVDHHEVMAQASSAAPIAFEVASVKPTNGGDSGPRGISFSPSGRFAWNRMTLKQLMQSAFGGVEFKDIVGGPRWIDTDRFDIVATSPDALSDLAPDGSPRGLFLRLRTLLEDRFQLKTHVENRQLPVYALQPVALPIVPGPNLRRTDIDCEAAIRNAVRGRGAVPDGGAPPCSMRPGPGSLFGHSITMNQLAGVLSGPAVRPVIDRTDLAGTFDVELHWAPEFPPGTLINGAPPPPSDGPSLFTAIREQLGLKLEAIRADVPVLVVDAAERPTPD
jgi:uncharacterized protein (TIGR03435 family)